MTHRGIPSRFEPEAAPPELFARVRAAVQATPASTISTRLRVMLAMAAVPCLAAAVLLVAAWVFYDRSMLRFDLTAQPAGRLLFVLLLLAAVTLAATLVAVGRGARGLGPGVVSLLLVACLVAPIHAALLLGSDLRDGAADPAYLSPWGWRCLTIASVVGLLVLVSFAAALRRSAPVASRLRAAAVGATAGTWAGLTVFLFCPSGEPLHLLVGHVLPTVAFTLLGLAALPRALRP